MEISTGVASVLYCHWGIVATVSDDSVEYMDFSAPEEQATVSSEGPGLSFIRSPSSSSSPSSLASSSSKSLASSFSKSPSSSSKSSSSPSSISYFRCSSPSSKPFSSPSPPSKLSGSENINKMFHSEEKPSLKDFTIRTQDIKTIKTKIRVNNGSDAIYPRESVEKIKSKLSSIQSMKELIGPYNPESNNCEHFVNYIRYGKKFSDQVTKTKKVVAAGVLAGVTSCQIQ